ncbi:14330_t:CDS:2, partial [Gigaspora margarita]
PIAYIACQTSCNAGWVACYAAARLIAGTVTGGLGAPAAAILCNIGQGTCMAACAAILLAPTP